MDKKEFRKTVKSAFIGFTVGDALGVPFEFQNSEEIKLEVLNQLKSKGFSGGGFHNQPPGTFSDDSSLMLLTAESLSFGYNLRDIAKNMIKWYYNGYWTSNGRVFDIGNTTRKSIERLKSGISPEKSGFNEISSNGNGSLIRILPLAFFYIGNHIEKNDFSEDLLIKEISSITHSHPISVFACNYYVLFTYELILKKDKYSVFKKLQKLKVPDLEIRRIFKNLIQEEDSNIFCSNRDSSCYVVATLETVIHCILTTENYTDAVIKAISLGDDTDSIAALTGALAGIIYGYEDIPKIWKENVSQQQKILKLSKSFSDSFYPNIFQLLFKPVKNRY